MIATEKPWDAWLKQEGPAGVRRGWNRPVVAALMMLTVLLELAGLFADLQLGSRGLTIASYAAAVLSGSVLLAFLFNKRLWVTRRPG